MDIVFAIIGIITFVAIIITAIVLSITSSKKNAERNRINSLIYKDSVYIKELDKINNKYDFEVISKTFKIKRYFNDVRNFRNFNPDLCLAEFMISNSESIINIIKGSKYQKEQYPKYLEEYNNIKSGVTNDDASKIGVSLEEYQTFEKDYYSRNLKKFKINIKFKVSWFLENSARKDKNKKIYNLDEASDIFYAYYRQDLAGFTGTHADFIKKERALLTESLRYDILRRDGFRCQICGATAKDGVKLHVDHIIPVSKGGKTEPQNLRTLCDRCNLGKSNKIE